MDLQSLYSDVERTFEFDESLPPLPVPALRQTLHLYLESVRPHVSDEEFNRTRTIVTAFEKNDGQLLHKHLVNRSKNLKNWLEDWWEKVAYLSQRIPLIPTSNFCSLLPFADPLWSPGSFAQVPRAALITYFMLQFWKLLRSERLKPDKPRGERWSMSQFRRCFNTVRIPGENIDKLVCRFVTEREGPPASSHIIVLCRGHIYKMTVLNSQHEPISPTNLNRQFAIIQEACSLDGHEIDLASLTYGQRSQWAKDRAYLIQLHADNAENLQIIESAIMVVSLDEASPTTDEEIMSLALGGKIGGRWADTLTAVVFKNGTTTFNADHTPCDGMVGMTIGAFINYHFMTWRGDLQVKSDDLTANSGIPVKLSFKVDATVTKAIKVATHGYSKLVDAIASCVLNFSAFGKALITSLKINPDTFVQLALQLAYFRVHDKFAPTYETATTRRFYRGRTETVRSCTVEATQWVNGMLSTSTPQSERLALFQEAVRKHENLMKMAKRNEGCDRHLLGLYMMALELGLAVPEIFKDSSYEKSGGNGNFILSTSLTGYTPASGAVLAMCLNGYGVFYSISPQSIRFNITAWKMSQETSVTILQSNIAKSLAEVKALFTSSNL